MRRKEEGCTLSPHAAPPTWLLFLSERREEIEQINSDHQIPSISFTSPPSWIKVKGGTGGGGEGGEYTRT